MKTQAEQIERLASDVHSLAFDFAEPARSIQFAERRIAEAERIACALRAIVRGAGVKA